MGAAAFELPECSGATLGKLYWVERGKFPFREAGRVSRQRNADSPAAGRQSLGNSGLGVVDLDHACRRRDIQIDEALVHHQGTRPARLEIVGTHEIVEHKAGAGCGRQQSFHDAACVTGGRAELETVGPQGCHHLKNAGYHVGEVCHDGRIQGHKYLEHPIDVAVRRRRAMRRMPALSDIPVRQQRLDMVPLRQAHRPPGFGNRDRHLKLGEYLDERPHRRP